MAARQRTFILIASAPALADEDERPLAIVRGMEHAFPGLRLDWEVSKEGRPIPLPHREAWLAAAASRRKLPLLCNGDERYPITVFGFEKPVGLSPAEQPRLEIHVEAPLDSSSMPVVANVLEAVAEGSRAFWGRVLPDGVGGKMAELLRHRARKDGAPRGIPHHLGWLNYWSAATAKSLGFPDPARDAEWLSLARRTATGGWVLQMTTDPLDLDDPAHLAVVLRAYARFPEMGGGPPHSGDHEA